MKQKAVFIPHDLGELIDCDEKDFKKFCMKQKLGYLTSVRNLLLNAFNAVLKVINDLVDKGAGMTEEEKKDPKYVKTLEGLHSKMMIIDLKYMILSEMIESRQGKL